MKLLMSVFSCLYSRVKIFLFAVNNRRHLSIFVWLIQGLQVENKKSEVIFAVCRLPVNGMLSISIGGEGKHPKARLTPYEGSSP